jgi:2-iminobutanoate/2-iminopropanoate deaminase
MSRIAVTSERGVAVGPYSQAIDTGQLVFLSGQTPLDPHTGTLVEGGPGQQTGICLNNLVAVLSAAGLTTDDVVKCNVYLTDMDDFAEMNRVYASYFAQPPPARTTIAVAALPLGAHVEIEMVAVRP